MPERRSMHSRLNRRKLLQAGAGSFCALYLSGLGGCTAEQQGKEQEKTPSPSGPQKGFVKPMRSPWFSKLDNARVQCNLCPKECRLEEGERALCRVRENRGGEGYTLAYGNPALLQEDPVERKPFYHVLPGSRALSISTAGCNLKCKFCEVWDMALEDPEEVHAHDVPPEKVITYARQSNLRSVSYAFGEPVIFYEYMSEVAALAREKGLLNLMHTAGYIQPQPLQELTGKLDAVNVDLKSFDPEFYREIVGGELDPVLATLKMLRDEGVHLEITNILIPTMNDEMEKIREMCAWIAGELGPGVPLHFARFYPLYKLSELPRTPVSTLDEARAVALEAGLEFVYLTGVPGHEGENTFCPDCGEKIIDRMEFVIEAMHMENGECSYCGTAIPGRWA